MITNFKEYKSSIYKALECSFVQANLVDFEREVVKRKCTLILLEQNNLLKHYPLKDLALWFELLISVVRI